MSFYPKWVNNPLITIFEFVFFFQKITMFECEELEAKRDIYLATNISCTDRWYNILRKYSFATEGVCLGKVQKILLKFFSKMVGIPNKRLRKTKLLFRWRRLYTRLS